MTIAESSMSFTEPEKLYPTILNIRSYGEPIGLSWTCRFIVSDIPIDIYNSKTGRFPFDTTCIKIQIK